MASVITPAARNRSRSPRKVVAVLEVSKQPINDVQAKVKPTVSTTGAETGSGRHLAIVGGGAVGANTAFCIATAKTGHGKLTITDIAAQMLEGQVMDMEDTGMHCAAASPKEAGQADVIIITAGRGVRDGETRLDCLKANYGILSSIVGGMQPIKKSAVIIVVSNPCDVLAYFVWKFSGLPAHQVIGSGTTLDTTRLRAKVSDLVGMTPDSIHYNILGEHGDSMFPATSLATIAGVPLMQWPGMDKVDMEELEESVRIKGRLIREKKGATSFGIATSCKNITEAILQNKRQILPVSVKIPGEETFLSLPCVIGSKGVHQIVDVTPQLSTKEQTRWKECVEKMSKMTKEVA
jgi:L-lactate dehydrogenase